MKIYDFSDEICQVYVFGPILGSWQSFLRFIADRLFAEGPDRWLTEPEKVLHNAFTATSCQSVGNSTLPEPDKTRRILFSVGSSYLGRFNKEKTIKLLSPLNEYLKKHNCHLFLVRGGDDNPSYFNEDGIDLSNITPLPDYSVVTAIYDQNHTKTNILCVGGETPIFNSALKKLERIARQIPRQEDVKMAWDGTGFHFDRSEVDKLKDLDIEVLLTSASSYRDEDSVVQIMDSRQQILKESADVRKLVNEETLPSLNEWVIGRRTDWGDYYPHREKTITENAARILGGFPAYLALSSYDGEKGLLYKRKTMFEEEKLPDKI